MYERTPENYSHLFPTFVHKNPQLVYYLQQMQNRLIEQRLAKNIVNRDGKVVAPGIETLNRQGALYYLCHWIESNPHAPYTIHMFDIQGFKNLDRMADGYNLADFKLNQLSRSLQNNARDHELLTAQPTFVGRYGGDEFIIVSTGENVERYRQRLVETIEEGVEKVELNLKDGVETIDVPANPAEKQVFEHYLRRNLVLNQEELQKITPLPAAPQTEIARLPVRKDRRSDFSKTLRQLKFHNNTHLEPYLQNFYRQVVLRPGVEHEIFNINTFEQQMISNSMHTLWTLDIKFIKEVNDGVSYVEGGPAHQPSSFATRRPLPRARDREDRLHRLSGRAHYRRFPEAGQEEFERKRPR